ncbi:MAG: site-2 protease family protein [Deltaproteobacteria bacterium]|nr:site-2 protease family protein [Deltaproteobacteria bacterium]MBN2672655.1 site-2 protease family protein [Deltaproteobacteria bacterium]
MSWIIVIISLGILVVIHELGHYWLARLLGMKVMKYSVGFFKPIFTWTSKKTDITYQLGSIPLGGYVQVKGMNPFEEGAFEDPDSYQMKAPWKRGLVIVAGPIANLLTAWLILFSVVGLVGLPNSVDKAGVGQVIPETPAQKANLQENDRILQINGTPVATFEDVVSHIGKNPGTKVMLLVEREGRRFPVAIVPEDVDGVGKIGIYPPTETVRLPTGEAAVFAVNKCISVLSDTLGGLWGLITRTAKDVKPVGPPGIVKMAKTQYDSGATSFLAFMSYISLMLFLFNLLPIPALDGGRTVFLLYEVITRNRVNKKVDAAVNTVFFFLLMALIAIISIKEIFFG